MIRERGPVTVAAFMDLALYHPEFGYYARAAQRSGRAGDFFTSVDVGPVFGELLAEQIAQMATIVDGGRFDLVEAAAGNGRLSADVLAALRARHHQVYSRTALHLVERSAAARASQRATLGELAERLASTSDALPDSFEGVLVANELLDAMPVHQVVRRDDGLKEVYVAASTGDRLTSVEGPLSTPALERYLADAGVSVEPGWRVEINLAAADWMREAVRRLRRGFVLLFDYGHEARELYSVTHSAGTLTSFTRHVAQGAEAAGAPPWLHNPGEQDITAHVDFSTIERVAREEGATKIALLDQTYFVMGILLETTGSTGSIGSIGSIDSKGAARALKTLMMPGGLGSTLKVLILGKGVGTPPLIGCSFRVRVT